MPDRPVVLVHGYSDNGESFGRWHEILEAAGYDTATVYMGNYVSLSNEVTIKDIAEGFDRALRDLPGVRNGESFDAIVHSTGMLVVREWLAARPERIARLKHLIGLAPATFGSPMAHKGRSWLGAIFKGGKEVGPDFMEAGDQVLKGLELGSAYTWKLAHRDFLAREPTYGECAATPYPFVLVGLKDYGWLKHLVPTAGTDGVVRWAGTGFNSRKVVVDLTVEPNQHRVTIDKWRNATVPLVFLPDLNHSTILKNPSDDLVRMVTSALEVANASDYGAWARTWAESSKHALELRKATRWQQFVTRAVDERGDAIADYFIEVGTVRKNRFRRLQAFDLDVHTFKDDTSFRCFHVNLDKLGTHPVDKLAIRVRASSGTELVGYHGYNSRAETDAGEHEAGIWDAIIEFDSVIDSEQVQFFQPYTTTLVELRLNREPMPRNGANRVFWFGTPA